MKTKNKLKLALTFVIIMAASFIPSSYPQLFGDWICQGGTACRHIRCGFKGEPPTLHYGFRHWIFILMGITFTIITFMEIAKDEETKQNEK